MYMRKNKVYKAKCTLFLYIFLVCIFPSFFFFFGAVKAPYLACAPLVEKQVIFLTKSDPSSLKVYLDFLTSEIETTKTLGRDKHKHKIAGRNEMNTYKFQSN